MSVHSPGRPGSVDEPFLPLHKRAFGTAVGLAAALLHFVLTLLTMRIAPQSRLGLGLLSEYFNGYSVTWSGAFVGAAWAGFSGFVMGWFLAFCRNFAVAFLLIYVRARADLAQTRDLLDHI